MYHYTERRTVGESRSTPIRLWVAALSSDPEFCEQFGIVNNEPSFIVAAKFGSHIDQSFDLDRAGAETLRDMLNEALAAAPATTGGVTWTRPLYTPLYEVVDNVEAITDRFACCGAGPDQRDERTSERLHLPGCNAMLIGVDEDPVLIAEQLADDGAYDEPAV